MRENHKSSDFFLFFVNEEKKIKPKTEKELKISRTLHHYLHSRHVMSYQKIKEMKKYVKTVATAGRIMTAFQKTTAVGVCLEGAADAEWSDHLCKCAICSGSGKAVVNTEAYFFIFSYFLTSCNICACRQIKLYLCILLSCLIFVKECCS